MTSLALNFSFLKNTKKKKQEKIPINTSILIEKPY